MSEQMRKEFEDWINKSAVFKNSEWLESVGRYNYTSTQIMWEAWQASRQALVVELPRVTGDAVYDAQEVHDALDKAGVAYK